MEKYGKSFVFYIFHRKVENSHSEVFGDDIEKDSFSSSEEEKDEKKRGRTPTEQDEIEYPPNSRQKKE